MAAHKYWRCSQMVAPTDTLELGEFQLYAGGSRVDAAATLTANIASNSGTLAQLKDGVTSAGPYWSSGASEVVLSWVFPTAVDVDAVLLGCRTTIARFPTSGSLLGSDAVTPSGRVTVRGFGAVKFASGTFATLATLAPPFDGVLPVLSSMEFNSLGGRGVITDTVKTKATPSNVPTYCKVRLVRDIDGKVVRETWTNPITGVYYFDFFDETYTYTIIAIHPLGSFRAVIADRITPGLMP